jgi:guanine nucleotide-exchange factor
VLAEWNKLTSWEKKEGIAR